MFRNVTFTSGKPFNVQQLISQLEKNSREEHFDKCIITFSLYDIIC